MNAARYCGLTIGLLVLTQLVLVAAGLSGAARTAVLTGEPSRR